AARQGESWSERYGRELRANALIYKNKARWLPAMPQAEGLSWEWSRGYPSALAVSSADAFRDHGREILQNAPRVVRLTRGRDPSPVAQCDALSLITDLRLDLSPLGDAGLLTILRSPHLTSLKSLRVHWGRLTGIAIGDLGNVPTLASLEALEV